MIPENNDITLPKVGFKGKTWVPYNPETQTLKTHEVKAEPKNQENKPE